MPTPRARARLVLAVASLLAWVVTTTAAPAARAGCTSDAHCRGGRLCVDGTCTRKACAVDIDCPEPLICEAGVCVDDTYAPPPAPATAEPPPVPASLPPPIPTQPPPVPPPVPSGDSQTPAVTPPTTTTPPPPRVRPRRTRRQVVLEYKTEERSIPGLWIPGIVTTGLTYLITIPVGLGLNEGGAFAFVPIVGPWLMMSVDDEGTPLWIASGLMQAAGLTMIILGVAITRDVKVPVYAMGDEPDAPLLAVLPGQVGRDGVGLNLNLTRF